MTNLKTCPCGDPVELPRYSYCKKCWWELDLRNKSKSEMFQKGFKHGVASKKCMITYLESFIKFCKCGNPKGDCVCPDGPND